MARALACGPLGSSCHYPPDACPFRAFPADWAPGSQHTCRPRGPSDHPHEEPASPKKGSWLYLQKIDTETAENAKKYPKPLMEGAEEGLESGEGTWPSSPQGPCACPFCQDGGGISLWPGVSNLAPGPPRDGIPHSSDRNLGRLFRFLVSESSLSLDPEARKWSLAARVTWEDLLQHQALRAWASSGRLPPNASEFGSFEESKVDPEDFKGHFLKALRGLNFDPAVSSLDPSLDLSDLFRLSPDGFGLEYCGPPAPETRRWVSSEDSKGAHSSGESKTSFTVASWNLMAGFEASERTKGRARNGSDLHDSVACMRMLRAQLGLDCATDDGRRPQGAPAGIDILCLQELQSKGDLGNPPLTCPRCGEEPPSPGSRRGSKSPTSELHVEENANPPENPLGEGLPAEEPEKLDFAERCARYTKRCNHAGTWGDWLTRHEGWDGGMCLGMENTVGLFWRRDLFEAVVPVRWHRLLGEAWSNPPPPATPENNSKSGGGDGGGCDENGFETLPVYHRRTHKGVVWVTLRHRASNQLVKVISIHCSVPIWSGAYYPHATAERPVSLEHLPLLELWEVLHRCVLEENEDEWKDRCRTGSQAKEGFDSLGTALEFVAKLLNDGSAADSPGQNGNPGAPMPTLICGDTNSLPWSMSTLWLKQGSILHLSPKPSPSSLLSPETRACLEIAKELRVRLPLQELLSGQAKGPRGSENDPPAYLPTFSSAYESVLGKEPEYTNVHRPSNFVGTLDYIFYSSGPAQNGATISPLGVLDVFPKVPELLPNDQNPSDHLPLVCEFAFRTANEEK